MIDVLVILQNAYGTTIRRRRQLRCQKLWLQGLWASHTGRRLVGMLPENFEVVVVNASPEIGERSNATYPADSAHIQAAIDQHQPRVVLACGRVAQKGVAALGIPHIAAPHPAWRALSKRQVEKIRQELIYTLAQGET